MLRNGAKFLQRRLYSYINTWTGFTVFLILSYFLVATIIDSLSNSCSLRGLHSHCSLRHSHDNIAFKNLEGELSYQPFDVVYTWVNGSDPRWLAKKEKWSAKSDAKKDNNDTPINGTITASNHTLENPLPTEGNFTLLANDSTIAEVDADDTMSLNRYRDSEELRFSLRSLVKNAPWIRHIYIVTDNQVPYWLNLESTRLTVIPHEDIFLNKSHLPVFSSPAIEANLHRIPGLSKKFIYFNDDVFLGARVLPEDFISMRGAQKLVMSWDVPKCAPGCSDTWIGDGFCDKACNVSSCNFDFPDCINGTNSNANSNNAHSRPSSSLAMCNKGCPDNWLADKICDQRCKNAECGWDVGDCGIDLVALNYPGVAIDPSNARILATSSMYGSEYGPGLGSYQYGSESGLYFADEAASLTLDQIQEEVIRGEVSNNTLSGIDSGAHPDPDAGSSVSAAMSNETTTTSTSTSTTPDSIMAGHQSWHPHLQQQNYHHRRNHHKLYPALTVEYGTLAVYFDLAHLGCLYCLNATCIPEQVNNVVYEQAEHDDEDGMVVHSTTILTRHHLLVVLLYHGQDGALPFTTWSQDVKFTVTATSSATAESTTATFNLRVLAQGSAITPVHPQELVPKGMALLVNQSYVGACQKKKAHGGELSLALSNLDLLAHPYRISKTVKSEDEEAVQEGVIVRADVSMQGTADLALTDCSQVVVQYELTGVTGGKHSLALSLCDALLVFNPTGTNSTEFESVGEFVAYEHDDSVGTRSVQALLARAERSSAAFAQYVSSKAPPRSPRFLVVPSDNTDAAGTLSTAVLSINTADADNTTSAAMSDLSPVSVTKKEIKSQTVHLKLPLPRPYAAMPASRWFHVQASFYHIPASQATNQSTFDRWVESSAAEIFPGASSLSCFTAAVKWGPEREVNGTTESIESSTASTNTQNTTQAVESALSTVDDTSATVLLSVPVPEVEHANSNDTVSSEQTPDLPSVPVVESAVASVNGSEGSVVESGETASQHRRLTHKQDTTILTSLRSTVSSLLASIVTWLSPTTSSTEENNSHHHRRRLEDTYGQSLVHVNRLYTKTFGTEGRKVPAHVPHMIDKDYMDEMQARWPEQWNATSSHRFRSPTDMQYSFSYYYYLSNRIKVQPHSLEKHVRTVLDTDHDGYLNENEFRSLAAMVKGSNSPSDLYLEGLKECIANSSTSFHRKHVEEVVHTTKQGKVTKSFELQAHPSIAEALNCSDIENGLLQKVNWAQLYPSHTHESDKDLVAFEMIGDNYTISLSQLDSVRQRQSKFVCINDNMKHPSKELEQALRSFYLSFFPEPCVFELPPGTRNPTLYLDEYYELRRQRSAFTHRLKISLLALPRSVAQGAWRALRVAVLPLARRATYLLDGGDTSETVHSTERVVNGLRDDISRVPHSFQPSPQEEEEWAAYSRNVLLFSVVGVVGFALLRQLSKGKGRGSQSN